MKSPHRRIIIVLGFLLLFTLALAACSQEPEQVEVTRVVEVTREVEGPTVEVTRVVEVPMETEPAVEVPFEELWMGSGHADATAEAFVHWNEDDPPEVPTSCAKCHSTPGYQDYIGADGSEAGVVDQAAPIGTTVECVACHNDVTLTMSSVVFPSGVEVTGLGPEARCMQCHQGRESGVSVAQAITDAGLGPDDLDTVSEDLGFLNIHYYAAAATMYGTVTNGGFQYEGQSYDAKFDHVPEVDTCVDCHSPHTLELQYDTCVECHEGLTGPEELLNVRMAGSLVDYNGNGDTEEGIYYEIEGLKEMLYQAMQAYSSEVAGQMIGYNADAYPYFFNDTNADGEISEDEAVRDNGFASWTPRLLEAAYNYQVSQKDPGRFAHGGKYIIQLVYDSIASLNEAIAEPIDLSNAHRIDAGHFAGSEEAFRHWDEEGEVPGSCSRCHSAAGLPLFIEQGVAINQPTANGLNCATCHNDLTTFTRYEVAEVPFPNGAVLTLDDPDANLCINCHQGRESTVSVNRRLQGLDDDAVSDQIRFVNIHYFAAGATLFGNQAQGAYEYDGQTYLGRNEHVSGFDTCTECHSTHALTVEFEACANCHEGVASEEDLMNIRVSEVDYDGDGDVTEGMAGEVAGMADALYVALQGYANGIADANAIVYDGSSYPYFFNDLNGNGEPDPDEVSSDNGYNTWTPRLLRGAYNYQYSQKDPGAFAHNGKYVIQVLYDSINDLGGDTAGMTRPTAEAG